MISVSSVTRVPATRTTPSMSVRRAMDAVGVDKIIGTRSAEAVEAFTPLYPAAAQTKSPRIAGPAGTFDLRHYFRA